MTVWLAAAQAVVDVVLTIHGRIGKARWPSRAVGSLLGSGAGVRAAKASTSEAWTRLLAVALLLSSARALARIV